MEITIRVPSVRDLLRSWRWTLLAIAVVIAAVAGGASEVQANESITSPDTAGDVGQYASLALDAAGNPVVGYRDVTNNDLKVLHCDDTNCAAGGDSITAPDTGIVGFHVSLVLDALGNPVVAYLDAGPVTLTLLHCNDPHCSGVGESITTPDATFNAGQGTSLLLDAAGNPVISHWDVGNRDLRVVHCDDPNCAAGGESATSPDTVGDVGSHTSLALDASGYPVVSYIDQTNNDLKLMHCNDPNCVGGDESITAPDPNSALSHTSLKLDAQGHPIVAYVASGGLRVLHCDDPNCSGGGEQVNTPVGFGSFPSLELDAAGNPVIAYTDGLTAELTVLHCDDADCAGGGESITLPDTGGEVGTFTSLELDALGRPVVAYYDPANDDLQVLHCNDVNCSVDPKQLPINITNLGQYALPKTCFEVRDAAQTPLFGVCDNDFAGAPDSHVACAGDGVCDDEDPDDGEVSVTVVAGEYRVVQTTTAPQHTGNATKEVCPFPVGGEVSCELTFLNTPATRPWHPWDVTGDGRVRVADISQVVQRFNDDKPLGP